MLERQKVTCILAEPSGSHSGERPVFGICYSGPFLGENGKVVLTEFKPAWTHRL